MNVPSVKGTLQRELSPPLNKRQRELGAFYTVGNPFVFDAFGAWFRQIPELAKFAEPFCGSGQILSLLEDAGYAVNFSQFDIDSNLSGVEHRDSLAEFPTGFDVVITNPPYLSVNFAKRKGLDLKFDDFLGFSSLYQVAISLALNNANYVAMIIPESFITSGLFQEKLQSVISLPFKMFDDTDMPTCLALWGPDQTESFSIFRQNQYLGSSANLLIKRSQTACASRIRFNVPDGNVGLRAIDNSTTNSIRFCSASEIPLGKVKNTARLLTRLHVESLESAVELIGAANILIDEWRAETKDVTLTAFKGTRKDGVFRRRLDFATARAILSEALCSVEGHAHKD